MHVYVWTYIAEFVEPILSNSWHIYKCAHTHANIYIYIYIYIIPKICVSCQSSLEGNGSKLECR